jgi:DNA-binding response OmpR family regulator
MPQAYPFVRFKFIYFHYLMTLKKRTTHLFQPEYSLAIFNILVTITPSNQKCDRPAVGGQEQGKENIAMEQDTGTILVVEDEVLTRTKIRRALLKEGFKVTEAESGEDALDLMQQEPFKLIVLDIILPGMDGFEVCSRAREAAPEVAIIILSNLGGVEDRLRGLTLGADDYMVKPFSAEELVARTRAVLRRARGPEAKGECLEFRTLKIEFHSQRCFKAGRDLDLTPKEFRILSELCSSPGIPLSRETLAGRVWGKQHFGSDKSLDVYIRRLRQKVEDDPSDPALIRTVWGFGYVCE